MIDRVMLEFSAQIHAADGKQFSLEMQLQHTLTERLNLVGMSDKNSQGGLHLGATFSLRGNLSDGRGIMAETAILTDICQMASGTWRYSFAPESVLIFRDAGPYSKSLFPSGTSCEFRWLLTSSTWLDSWLKSHPEVSQRQLAVPGLSMAVELGCELFSDGIPVSDYGHIGDNVYNVPYLLVRIDVYNKTIRQLMDDLPRKELRFVCAALSCLSRSKVDFIEEEVTVIHSGESQNERQNIAKEIRRPRCAVPKLFAESGILSTKAPVVVLNSVIGRLHAHGDGFVRGTEFYVSSFVLDEEQEFVSLTTSLEALKQWHLGHQSSNGILSDPEFTTLRENLSRVIMSHEGLQAEACKKAICEKLPELNRPSYAAVVCQMCESIGVKVRDIYPNVLTFIGIRNEMIHQGKVPDRATLLREISMLRSLVELILKRLLLNDVKK